MSTRPPSTAHLLTGCRHRSGTAALEFVVIVPVLLVIVAGAADLSRAIRTENTIANAARVGAAYGATHSFTAYTRTNWESRVREAAQQEAANLPNYESRQLNVAISVTSNSGGTRRIQVDVSYPFELILGWKGSGSRVTITRSVTMQTYR